MANPWDMDPIVRKQDPWDLDPVVGRTPVQETAETYTPSREPAPESNPIRALQLGAQSVGRGLGNLVTGPIAITNMAANGLFGLADMASQAAGGPEIPFRFQTDHGERLAEGAGDLAQAFGVDVIPWEDRTASERLRGNIQSFGTEALAGGGALARQAPRLAEKIAGGGAPNFFDNFVRPYVDNPRAVIGDVAAGAGAGAGSTIAEERFPDSPIAQLIGVLAGGGAGALGADVVRTGDAARAGAFDNLTADRNVGLDSATGHAATRAETHDAARLLQELARDPQTGVPMAPSAARAIGENANTFREAGLPVPSTGLIADNIGLQTAEAAARTSKSAPFVQQDSRLRAAATERVNSVRDPGADQAAVKEGVEQRIVDLRSARDDDALPYLRAAEESGATVNAQPVADLIDAKMETAKRPAVRAALAEARKSLNAIGADDLDTSVSGLYETRKTINDIIEGRGESATGRFAQSELIDVRDALDNAINEAAPDFGEYLRRFREGSEPLDAMRDSTSVAKLLDDDPRNVAKRIFTGQDYEVSNKLDEIAAAIEGDEAAQRGWKAAVAEVLADMTSGTAKVDGGAAGTGAEFRTELGKLDAVFKRHRANLAKVFTPEEMRTLQQGHAVLEPLRNATIRATAGSNTADKYAQIWRLAEAGLKARFGVLKGGGILRTLRIVAETLPNNNQAVQRLIERAYFDPDLAQYLLTRRVRDLDAEASNKWVRRALAVNAAGRAGGGDDEP